MAELAAWLERIGLGQYADAFAEAAIGLDVLPDLSEDDLAALGVKLGDRKRLLKAIADLAGAGDVAEERAPRSPASAAERRQLTVMFVDLVGSTGLSRRLDPEDMSAVMRAYHGRTTQVIRRWGGHVAKYLGDGVLAYFGWPAAHEDDPERAVRAGLAVAHAVAEIDDGAGRKLVVRVGIATGPVVVGELIGEGSALEQAVVGETPNLAARLQALADPGAVVISQATRRLLGGLFELADLGPRRLKGFAEPLTVWRVEGEAAAESRFEATRGKRLTPLVGREHELGLLLDRWSRARDGEGQVVLLSGEAGIGKSRLIQVFRERIRDEPHTPLPHYGSAHHTSSAFNPIVRHLERAAGFARDDPPDVRLDKLEALLRPSTDEPATVVPPIAALLGLEPAERYAPLDLTPQRRKRLTLEALVGQVEALARERPVLAIYEDVHWFDASSLDAISHLIERVADLRVMVLVAFRPDFTPPWQDRGNMRSLSLARLARCEGAEILARLTRGRALPAEIEAELLARSDGIPLFVEELTKAVLESGLLDESGATYTLKGPLPPRAIPSSLQDSLMARLDRLALVKEVAQIASVIGRDFPYSLLAAVAGRSEAELSSALLQLEAAELIFRRGVPPEVSYTFKHALVQDVAYQSLLKSRRQHLHAKFADVLEQGYPESAPELLALHCTEAGLDERAVRHWHEAGQRATQRSANVEAVEHFTKALELLAKQPQSSIRDQQELELQIALGSPLIVAKGYAAPEVEQAYLRARDLSRRVGDTPRLFISTWGLWLLDLTRMRLNSARRLADELSLLASHGSDPAYPLQASHATWTTCLYLPELAACAERTERGLHLYDRDQHRSHRFVYGGHDPGVCAGNYGALTEWLLGFPDRAVAQAHGARALARELGHPFSLVLALAFSSFLHQFRREPDPARKHAVASMSICGEQEISPHYLAIGSIIRGWADVENTKDRHAIAEIRRGLDHLEGTHIRQRRPYYLAILAEAYGLIGEPERALEELRNAAAFMNETGEALWKAEIHRLAGEMVLQRSGGEAAQAEASFREALHTARQQEAKSLELRAARDLARLWGEQGERKRAYDLLSPIYGWFTEGFETPDLKEAKALLDQLA